MRTSTYSRRSRVPRRCCPPRGAAPHARPRHHLPVCHRAHPVSRWCLVGSLGRIDVPVHRSARRHFDINRKQHSPPSRRHCTECSVGDCAVHSTRATRHHCKVPRYTSCPQSSCVRPRSLRRLQQLEGRCRGLHLGGPQCSDHPRTQPPPNRQPSFLSSGHLRAFRLNRWAVRMISWYSGEPRPTQTLACRKFYGTATTCRTSDPSVTAAWITSS